MPHADPERRRRHERRRSRRRSAERVARGLCPRCGDRPPGAGRAVCDPCAGKRRLADRARAARRRQAGIGRVRDPEARKVEYRRARQRAEDRLAQGRCAKCGLHDHEPDRRLCAACAERTRRRDRERYAQARARGLAYGRASPHGKRRQARIRSRKRRQARRDAHLCLRCGRRRPVDGGSSCGSCLETRRAADRATYRARRSLGQCVRCATPTFDGDPLCGPCAVIESRRQPARNAAARRRYDRRRKRSICTHCGKTPSFGASRCEPCSRRAYERSEHVRGLPVYGAEFTVVHAATAETLAVVEHWEDVVLCLSFAGLSFDEVDIITEHAPMRAVLTGFS